MIRLTHFLRIHIIILFLTASSLFALDPVFWSPNEHPMMPKWAFGYWQVGFAPVPAESSEELLRLAKEHRDSEHPGDVWILDLGGWNCHPDQTGWDSEDWCPGKFDDPAETIRLMNEMNWHVGINYHPWTTASGDRDNSHFRWTMLRDAEFGSEIPWIDIRGTDPIWWMWDILGDFWGQQQDKRFLMLNYYGSFTYGDTDQDHEWDLGRDAKYPAYWTGDTEPSWRSFHDQIKRITHDGMWDGLFTLHMDTPGHFWLNMKEYPELTIRAVQFSDFSPLVQQHGQGGRLVKDATPEVQEMMIFSRKLRYRMLPYIYTYNWQMWKKALPLTRPMNMVYPMDASVAEQYQQYMFGENILVAPVTTDRHNSDSKAVDFGKSTMKITLPSQESWIDYWSHEMYEGGTVLDHDISDWNHIPLFIKKGSIIPMGPEIKWIDEEVHPDPLTLDIYPADIGYDAQFDFYDDDGTSFGYQEQQNEGALTMFKAETEEDDITVTVEASRGTYDGKPDSRSYIMKINLMEVKSTKVTVNGDEVDEADLDKILDGTVKEGWAFDALKGVAYVRYRTSTNTESVVVYSLSKGTDRDDIDIDPESSNSEPEAVSSSDEDDRDVESSDEDEGISQGNITYPDEWATDDDKGDDESSEDISALSPFLSSALIANFKPITHMKQGPLTLTLENGTNHVALYSVGGELLFSQSVVGKMSVDVGEMPQGLLFVRVK